MRNLKRVLSLALTSAMLLGMMVIGAGAADKTAADLSDMDKVVNKDAVNLMVDLGVITGKPDGSYAPTETVDRATMSTLIYKIVTGETDASAFKGASSTLADVKGTWAEGFINYCSSMNIVNGDGTKFYPENKVTVVQAAKMLLVSIGYDADLSKYSNDSMWSVNIMRDAQKAGLLAGIEQKASDELTRDNAAKMIFNTIFAEIVKPVISRDQGVAYLSEYKGQETTLAKDTYKLAKIEATVDGINKDGTAKTIARNSDTNNAKLDGKLAASPELAGANVVAYFNTNTNKLVSTSLSGADSIVLGTSTDGTAIANLTAKNDKKFIAEQNGTATIFVNGEKSSETIGVGSVVELVDNDKDGKANVVRITNKSVAEVKAAPVVSGDTVTISGIPGLAKVSTANVTGYSDLVKGDYVLYVQIGNKYYIEKAAVIEGVVSSKHSTKGLLVAGTYYLDSEITGATNTWNADYTNTYKFYLDNGKNIVKAVKVTDEAATASYVVPVDVAWVTGSGVGATNYVEAKVLLTDGTTEVVKIASVDGVKPVVAGSFLSDLDATNNKYDTNDQTSTAGLTNPTHEVVVRDAGGVGNGTKVTAGKYIGTAKTSGGDIVNKYFGVNSTADAKTLVTLGQFYAYTKNSAGAYVLTAPVLTDGTTTALQNLGNGAIKTGDVKFNGTSGNLGNGSTVFIFANTDAAGTTTYTTYTGINNVPTTVTAPGNQGTKAVVINDAGYAAFVYVTGTTTQSASSDYVYITSDEYATGSKNGTAFLAYDAIINGVAGTINVPSDKTSLSVGLYSVTSVNSNEISTLTGAGAWTPFTTATGVKSVSEGTIILGENDANSSNAYVFTDDTQVFYIDTDNKCAEITAEAISVDGNDEVYVVKNTTKADQADIIYVIQVTGEPTALTLAGGTSGATASGDFLDGTAEVAAWANATKTINIDVTAQANTTVVMTINGKTVTDATDFDLSTATSNAAAHTLTLRVVVTDDFSKSAEVYTYDFTVAAKS